MHIYLIKYALPDGSGGTYRGLFHDAFEAIIQALADFPDAQYLSAKALMRAPGAGQGATA